MLPVGFGARAAPGTGCNPQRKGEVGAHVLQRSGHMHLEGGLCHGRQ